MKIRISIFIFLSTQNVFSLRQYKTREIFSLIHLTHSNFNFLKIGYYTRELEEISDKQDHTNHQHLGTHFPRKNEFALVNFRQKRQTYHYFLILYKGELAALSKHKDPISISQKTRLFLVIELVLLIKFTNSISSKLMKQKFAFPQYQSSLTRNS